MSVGDLLWEFGPWVLDMQWLVREPPLLPTSPAIVLYRRVPLPADQGDGYYNHRWTERLTPHDPLFSATLVALQIAECRRRNNPQRESFWP